MGTFNTIDGLSALGGAYRGMLCDAWGVIHNGVALLPGAAEAMVRFREECGPLVILTNAPRPSSIIPGQLDALGLPRSAYDAVVTSGDATRAEIARRADKPAFKIGPEKDDPLFEGLDVAFADMDEAGFIICTGLIDDHKDEPEDYRPMLLAAAKRNLPMICANPDIIVNWGGRQIWCAGALAQIYEALGGRVVYGGKPHAPIYDLAMGALEQAAGQPLERRYILALGDGLKTDIQGANNQSIDAVLVAGDGGIAGGAFEKRALASRLKEAGVHAVAAMETLKW
ncbi:MAG: TIGR01459 family HAD-type hydrolase [Pseudomonadota bacterium]